MVNHFPKKTLGYHFWGLMDCVAHFMFPKRETWVCDRYERYFV